MDPNYRAYVARGWDFEPAPSTLNVFLATLEYPADIKSKSLKLVQDIDFFSETQGPPDEPDIVSGPPWYLWWMILDLAACVPPDHEWQDCLVQVLEILDQRDEKEQEEKKETGWSEYFSYLSMAVTEQHDRYYSLGSGNASSVAQWKNFTSFIARTSTHSTWRWRSIIHLREALEEPPVKGPDMECRLWVVTEWIIRCAGDIFEEMNHSGEIKDSTAWLYEIGPNCDAKRVLSLERWKFWKKRLSELAADAEELELGSTITTRITKALEAMAAVEP
ncbi:hypothetical protein NM208_g9922 [Fusarium decemcellulare]|uniref:Uncharacterized protein n=1 Tax=Fusarium decemcellulare TaxID=57161 RepID=A0ACC1RZR2_9HYPO|nr:hypothetical protein NM208_g9922 [Fusarium decemcellulare]